MTNPNPTYYLAEGTPCQWCRRPLTTLRERNESVCEACFQALDARHAAREALIRQHRHQLDTAGYCRSCGMLVVEVA